MRYLGRVWYRPLSAVVPPRYRSCRERSLIPSYDSGMTAGGEVGPLLEDGKLFLAVSPLMPPGSVEVTPHIEPHRGAHCGDGHLMVLPFPPVCS